MGTIAIGDIHGCRVSLEKLVEFVGIEEGDTIVTLGDYVDRGPDTRGVIDFLLELRERRKVVCLMGNHESMMLEARESPLAFMSWLVSGIGGVETLASYGEENFEAVPAEHWTFIENLTRYCETKTHFFVHANAEPELPLEVQDDHALLWQRFNSPAPHQNGKVMVCGHTSQQSGRPVNLGHAICIDTWACGTGWLTALEVESGRYWQTNESGQKRSGDIAEFLRA